MWFIYFWMAVSAIVMIASVVMIVREWGSFKEAYEEYLERMGDG